MKTQPFPVFAEKHPLLHMMIRRDSRLYFIAVAAVLSASLLACGSDSPQPKKPPVPQTPFERDLQFIRNGNFTYIWVFSRPDGKALDKDDAAYLRTNAPQVIDWVITDEGKRAIGGTNFDLEQGGLSLLRQRFVVEDYTGK